MPPDPIERIWCSRIVGLRVAPIAVVPIVVHKGCGFRRLATGESKGREFCSIGSFETDAEIINVTFEGLSETSSAVVDGQVHIEPLRQ
eukprot:1903803-Prymnesium_polylepis.1